MGFTRSRESQRFIIQSHQSIFKKCLLSFATALIWGYSLVVFYLFFSGLFDHNDPMIAIVKIALNITNDGIQAFFLTCFSFFCLAFIGLLIWRTYNKKRFGSLTRRTYPLPTTATEILALQLIAPNDYDRLHAEQVVVFETNPIRDLTAETLGEDTTYD